MPAARARCCWPSCDGRCREPLPACGLAAARRGSTRSRTASWCRAGSGIRTSTALAIPLRIRRRNRTFVLGIGVLASVYDADRLGADVAPLLLDASSRVASLLNARRTPPFPTRPIRARAGVHHAMSWQPELDELAARTRMAHAMGGPDKVKRQHDAGRLTIRERIDKLVDARQLPRGGRAIRHGQLRSGRRSGDRDAGQRHLRPRHDQRPDRGRARRRLHRARRLGRCDDRCQAADGRADGKRVPLADRTRHRGLGRRRLGEDDRDQGPRQPARRHRHLDGVPPGDGEHVAWCRSWGWAWARSPGWARRGWLRAITA